MCMRHSLGEDDEDRETNGAAPALVEVGVKQTMKSPASK